MIAEVWIAHILAAHLAVPEPVTFKYANLKPVNRCAQIRMTDDRKWVLEYDRICWVEHQKAREWVIAHELCHAAYMHSGCTLTGFVEDKSCAKREEKEANQCANQVIQRHKEEGKKEHKTRNKILKALWIALVVI